METQWMYTLVCVLVNGFYFTTGVGELLSLPGHLQRLGAHGPIVDVDTIVGFPKTKDFFDHYVFRSKPLKMKEAVLDSFPSRGWTDEYFLSLNLPDSHTVRVLKERKQNVSLSTDRLHFQKFVELYNTTGQYMATTIPDFLRKDVILPDPLHCVEIYDNNVVDVYMWYSNGGTTTSLHSDSADIINCVYHGNKTFMMIDPNKYYEKVYLDLPMSEGSLVDVDRVDFEKYPGLAEVEFTVVNVTAGDCIFVPFKWYHTVKSYSRNIGLSTAWDHFHVTPEVMVTPTCRYNTALTLDNIHFNNYRLDLEITNIRGLFMEITKRGPITVEEYDEVILNEFITFLGHNVVSYMKQLEKVETSIDKNNDGKITMSEAYSSTIEEMASFLLDNKRLFLEIFRKVTDLVDQNNDGLITRIEAENLTHQDWLMVQSKIIEGEELMIDMKTRLLDPADVYFEQISEDKNQGEPRYEL